MNIVILSAHPDDAESGCFGLALKAVQSGHRVVAVYMTSGAAGVTIFGRPEAVVREEEARAACALCGVEPMFFAAPVADLPYDREHLQRVSDMLRELDADVVLGHWPVDTHPDHQAAAALATQAVVGNPDVALIYFEVITGVQTFAFEPTHFVDITEHAARKKQAVDCHRSQNVAAWWPGHDAMERFRAFQGFGFRDDGNHRAEAFRMIVSTPQAESLFDRRAWLQPSGGRVVRSSMHEDINLFPPPAQT